MSVTDDHIHELMTAARDALAEALKLAEELSDQLSVELLLSSLEGGEPPAADGESRPDPAG